MNANHFKMCMVFLGEDV